jgi:hypothetical protein
MDYFLLLLSFITTMKRGLAQNRYFICFIVPYFTLQYTHESAAGYRDVPVVNNCTGIDSLILHTLTNTVTIEHVFCNCSLTMTIAGFLHTVQSAVLYCFWIGTVCLSFDF